MKFHVKIMFSRILAGSLVALSATALTVAAGEMPARASITAKSSVRAQFRSPALAAATRVTLPAMSVEKEAASPSKPNEPLRVGTVRALPKAAAIENWSPLQDGFVTRALVASEGASGIRARLDLSGLTTPIEVRVQGNDGRVEVMHIDPVQRPEAWTPWTGGPEQAVEVFSPLALESGAVRIGAVLHFTESPFAKAAASCTLSTQCTTSDAGLDAAMAERKKSVARMQFIEGTSGFSCTGTLINTERFPQAFFATANHCIGSQAVASTLTTFWSYEELSCGSGVTGPFEQLSGGAELVMANPGLDSTLLRLSEAPPANAVYAGWSNAPLQANTPAFSISHPMGDTSRWASGTFLRSDGRWSNPMVQEFNVVSLTRGLIQGGSSGSGLFTLANGSFQFRGSLLGHTEPRDDEYSCANPTVGQIYYGRFDVFEPQIRQYISLAAQPSDDAPNRARELFNTAFNDPNGVDRPLNERGDTLRLDNRRIDYVGDIDVYRVRVTATSWVSVWTEGEQDTIGMILDSRGVRVEMNDDWQEGMPYNMGITRRLTPGTYYVWVGHFEPTGTGAYHLRMRADNVDANYTALWWNPAENGWGLNLNHQGNTLFGTLYTYDASGRPTWFSMSNGVKQGDGSYLGSLARTTGPAFDASPWNPNAVAGTIVGNMRLQFIDDDNGILTYNVGGAQVVKTVTKLAFQTPPVCTWSASDRSTQDNYQDLWWGGVDQSGWGVNLAHQGDIVFSTLFTYDAAGQPRWFVMSDGRKTGSSMYSGALYSTTGPAFDSVPFTPITAANNTQVGTMTFTFSNGNSGTMSYTVNGTSVMKNIQRLAFAELKPKC